MFPICKNEALSALQYVQLHVLIYGSMCFTLTCTRGGTQSGAE